ncbi:TPA: helix-turn-helix transcriptional regulator [Stenotrophomonas maltophilia]|nr:helix-turn-helix transcriptional regulator [Stenotrophomonas maltophilia]
MTPIVHQPLPAAIWPFPAVLPDFSDTARWGLVLVQDSLNAPKYEPGDVLHVDLRRNYFAGDACYAVEIAGEQSIRFIQARPSGLYVCTRSDPGAAYPIAAELLVILGMVMYATTTRRVG